MGQIKNIKLHIVTDIKVRVKQSKMAYIARTLASMGRGLVRRASTHSTGIPTNTSATSVLSRCGIFNTITHHTPATTQLNTLLTRQRQTRATSRDADLAAKVEEEIEAESEQSRPIPKIRGLNSNAL